MPATQSLGYGVAGVAAFFFGGYVLRACLRGDIKNELYKVLDTIVGLALLLGGCLLIGKSILPCIQPSSHEEGMPAGRQHAAVREYICVMHPAVRQPRTGSCPICSMTLAGVDSHGNVQVPPKQTTGLQFYTCPSHAKVILPADGQCPICEKDLIPCKSGQKKMPFSEEKPIDPSQYEGYLCPMHPHDIRDAAGKCSKCGMDLVLARKKREE